MAMIDTFEVTEERIPILNGDYLKECDKIIEYYGKGNTSDISRFMKTCLEVNKDIFFRTNTVFTAENVINFWNGEDVINEKTPMIYIFAYQTNFCKLPNLLEMLVKCEEKNKPEIKKDVLLCIFDVVCEIFKVYAMSHDFSVSVSDIFAKNRETDIRKNKEARQKGGASNKNYWDDIKQQYFIKWQQISNNIKFEKRGNGYNNKAVIDILYKPNGVSLRVLEAWIREWRKAELSD